MSRVFLSGCFAHWYGFFAGFYSDQSVVVPTKPHQSQSFSVPKRSFGLKKSMERRFQLNWFAKWSFLHCDEHNNVFFCCHTCLMAFKQRIKTSKKTDPAFVSSKLASMLN